MNIQFRLAKENDAEDLVKIYAPYVESTDITFEYTVPTMEEFKQRIKDTLTKFPYIVSVIDGKIVGYAYAQVFRKRIAYSWGVEMSIYIMKEFQGKQLGEKLYTILEKILQVQNITNLYASITYPHPQSIAFHKKMGYKKIAHFTKCGYKQGKWLDMIFMEKMINIHTVPAKDIVYLPDIPKEQIEKFFHMY